MDGWTMLAHAINMRHVGWTVVSAGVAVRLEGDEHVAVGYGGHRETCKPEAVTAAVRAALKEWPETIGRVEIACSVPKRLTDHDRRAIARAEAKRARRRQRHRATNGSST